MRFVRLIYLVLVAVAVLCLAVLLVVGGLTTPHGLQRTVIQQSGYTTTELWPWPFVDGADFMYVDQPQQVRFAGVVWQGAAGQTTWRLVHNGAVTVRVNGETVFTQPEHGPLRSDDFTARWSGPWLALEIDYDHDPAALAIAGGRLEVGLYEMSGLRWALLPTYRLYPDLPEDSLVAQEMAIDALTTWALLGLAASLVLWGAVWAWRQRIWQRRAAWIGVGIVALALIVRFLLLVNRAAADPYFYHLVPGSDNYVLLARQVFAGSYALAGTYWQPGNILWLAVVMRLFGPHLVGQYVLTAFVGGLSAGAVVGAGWLAFGRRVGILAGLFAALYPPLVFYQTTLQVAALVSAMTAFALWAGVWAARSRRWQAVALFGLLTGITALVRPTMLVYGPAFALALALSRDRGGAWQGWRQVVALTALAAACTLLPIAPQKAANASVGEASLINANGPVTLYTGNNRDADGTTNVAPAWYVARYRHDGWVEATIKDLQADPLRAFSLLLRKSGVFWSNFEYPNNVDYYGQGILISPLLNVLALNGRLGMSALAWFGFGGLALLLPDRTRRRDGIPWLLLALLGLFMLGTVAFNVSARQRIAAAPLLCLPAAVMAARLMVAARQRRVDRPLLWAGGVALALLLVFQAFEYQLPRKGFFYGDLPPGAVAQEHDFGGEVRLRGFLPLETDHAPAGYAYVTLFWQAIAPPSADYAVFVHLVGPEGEKLAGLDEMLGGISYPDVGAAQWPVGATLAESYLVPLPGTLPPLTTVHVGLYDDRAALEARLPLTGPDGQPSGEDFVRLAALGFVTEAGFPTLPGEVTPVEYTLGEAIAMTGVQVPQLLTPGDPVAVGIQWEATAPVSEDYIAFFHLFDADRNLVGQSDGPALGDWPTSALVPGYPVGAAHTLELAAPLAPGEYLLRMGAYQYPSRERLAVHDAAGNELPDGLIDLGMITVEE